MLNKFSPLWVLINVEWYWEWYVLEFFVLSVFCFWRNKIYLYFLFCHCSIYYFMLDVFWIFGENIEIRVEISYLDISWFFFQRKKWWYIVVPQSWLIHVPSVAIIGIFLCVTEVSPYMYFLWLLCEFLTHLLVQDSSVVTYFSVLGRAVLVNSGSRNY